MSRRLRFSVMAALALSFAPPLAGRVDAPPHLSVKSFDALPQPLPLPYAEQADANSAVAAALHRARAAHKLLLIDLGGNWCLDCRLLAGTMDLPQLKPWLQRHFEVVTVDIGRYDKNLQIPARYGIAKPRGVPALLIVDPRTGKLRDAGHVEALADARSMNPQALAEWLGQWTHLNDEDENFLEFVPAQAVPSPCVNICRIDPHTRWCQGCRRTIEEIARWSSTSDSHRHAILAAVKTRFAS